MNDSQILHFGLQQLQPDDKGYVTLRGFLYKTPNGPFVLSLEPNLKSCCVGSQSKVMDQVYLSGEFVEIPASTVVEVTGIFKIDPLYSPTGTLVQYYTLQNISIKQTEVDYTLLGWFGAVLLGLLISVGFFQYWKRASQKT